MTPTLTKKEIELKVPQDLNKALTTHPKAKAQWGTLTSLARRDFITWIEGAKQPETRKRRIEKAWSVLAAGKRRPCCYSIIPINFYKSLGAYPQAKAQWHKLTPSERRDFADWIESANDPIERNRLMEKACALLAAGKRHA